MYKKRYGKIKVGAWLTLEMNQSNAVLMLILGVAFTLGGIAVRFAVGSPHLTVLALDIGELLPPVWMMCVFWTVAFFTVGCAAGFVLGYRGSGCEVDKYKGGMLFVLLAVFELCWYPTFFGAGLLFLSVLECILILCLSICVTVCFSRVSKFAGMLLLMHDIWLIYMLILNFAVFFRA
ncbi:MAG: tryptophan-rich sensory protein [Ruminococcaceae bacterium]|nr:tryptophan-rich sensory protein [Oscillospiraceae bacterium]